MADFSLCPHMALPLLLCACTPGISSSYKNTSVIGLGLHFMTSFNLIISLKDRFHPTTLTYFIFPHYFHCWLLPIPNPQPNLSPEYQPICLNPSWTFLLGYYTYLLLNMFEIKPHFLSPPHQIFSVHFLSKWHHLSSNLSARKCGSHSLPSCLSLTHYIQFFAKSYQIGLLYILGICFFLFTATSNTLVQKLIHSGWVETYITPKLISF